MLMAIRVGVNMLQFCSVSNSLSHTQHFQIKWEVYFSKRLCCSSISCRRYDFACICVCIVGHGYTIIEHLDNTGSLSSLDFRIQILPTGKICVQSWTSPGSSTPQDTNCTATCPLSRKLFKLDEPDMQDTAYTSWPRKSRTTSSIENPPLKTS